MPHIVQTRPVTIASLKPGGNYFGSGTEGRPYRRDAAAAVSAIASGSQHNTIKAMSHRIARSLSSSAPTPTNSATYFVGAASVSIWRPLVAEQFVQFRN